MNRDTNKKSKLSFSTIVSFHPTNCRRTFTSASLRPESGFVGEKCAVISSIGTLRNGALDSSCKQTRWISATHSILVCAYDLFVLCMSLGCSL